MEIRDRRPSSTLLHAFFLLALVFSVKDLNAVKPIAAPVSYAVRAPDSWQHLRKAR